jgi:hypothetical protein
LFAFEFFSITLKYCLGLFEGPTRVKGVWQDIPNNVRLGKLSLSYVGKEPFRLQLQKVLYRSFRNKKIERKKGKCKGKYDKEEKQLVQFYH